MARAKSKKGKSKAKASSGNGRGKDAIALLKADHRQVEEWFEQFEKARDNDRRQKLANQICGALKVHTQIEEEIFYPAFLEATKDEDMHHEAAVEHDGAKKLIADIESSTAADDDYFKSKVHVLSEMIKHHVKEEEQPGGMFAEARDSDMDLVELGQQMAARKAELEGGEMDDDMPPPSGRKPNREGARQMKSAR